MRTFYQINSQTGTVPKTRYPKFAFALRDSLKLTGEQPGHAFYVVKSQVQIKNGCVSPW